MVRGQRLRSPWPNLVHADAIFEKCLEVVLFAFLKMLAVSFVLINGLISVILGQVVHFRFG